MPSLNLTNQEIKENFALVAGVSRDSDVWDTDTEADYERILRGGRRKFFMAHQWRFLEQDWTILTTAPYETGTIQVASGVVTGTGTTFPGDATSGPREYMLEVSDGLYEIDVWTSATSLTLKDTSLTVASGTSYKIYRVRYPFSFSGSATLGGIIQPVYLENETRPLPNTGVMPNYTVERYLRKNNHSANKPEAYAIQQFVAETSGIPEHYLVLSPAPDAAYVLKTRIRIQPEDTYDFADSTASFHAVFSECLMAAILATTEIYYHNTMGVHAAEYQRLLPLCIQKDREFRGAKTLRSRRRTFRDPNYELRVGRGTYDGVE